MAALISIYCAIIGDALMAPDAGSGFSGEGLSMTAATLADGHAHFTRPAGQAATIRKGSDCGDGSGPDPPARSVVGDGCGGLRPWPSRS